MTRLLRLLALVIAMLAVAGCCGHSTSGPPREIRAEIRPAAEAFYEHALAANRVNSTSKAAHQRARQAMLDIYGEYPTQVIQVPVEKP